MRRIVVWIAILGFLYTSQSFGGWNSGGGDFVKDALNPWFIQNTATVKACIEIGEHFHFSHNVVDIKRDVVEKAISYWKKELADQPEYPRPIVRPFPKVATQEFIFEECDGETDLRFQ